MSKKLSKKFVTITLPIKDAKVLQAFWGSWFGGAKDKFDLGDVQEALDNLQNKLWEQLET